jgi:5-methylcytosine-specific restriction endonuclease McrA
VNPRQESRRVRQYTRRNEILARMGFRSYAAYLASPLWARVRRAFLDYAGLPCWSCGAFATQVHHGRYTKKNLTGESFHHLYALCRRCHEACEFSDDGEKLSPRDSVVRLKRTRRR